MADRRRLLYVVTHTHALHGVEDLKMIGVFTSRQRARDAISELRTKSGFRLSPRGFSINCLVPDRVHWEQGFV